MSNMVLPFRRHRTRQPANNVALNPGIPAPSSVFVPGLGDLLGKTPAVKPDGVTRNGRAWVLTNGIAERRVLNSSSGFFNATECSFLVIKEYRGTLGTGDGAGVVALGGALTKRCAFYFGSSGNVYFDFGGAANGTTRVSGTTNTAAGKTSVFLATTGPRGMRLFENGRLIGSNAASPVRTVDAALAFGLGDCYAGTSGNSAYTLAVPWNVQLPDELAGSISANPWQIFAPAKRVLFAPVSAGSSALAAAGAAQAGGSANLAAQVVLAAVGIAAASGSAGLSVAIPLSAVGFAVSSGTANAVATVTIAAAGFAQAAGSAGLSAALLLQGAGAAQAAGNAALAAQLNALASGAAQAAGSANLSGGAAGALNAAGQAQASGSAVLNVTVTLNATGGSQASGSANLSGGAPGQIAAGGGAQAGGSAQVVATVAISAAGYAQAMASGQLSIQIPLTAFGGAISAGSGVLTLVPDVVIEGVSEMLRVPGRRSLLVAPGRRFDLRV